MKQVYLLCCLLLGISLSTRSQEYTLEKLEEGKAVSFRGMSIPNDSTAWVSGTGGTVARTTDGGAHWDWFQVKGFDSLDFRSIVAFSDQKAIVVNAGSPAYILMTEDGGNSWKEVFSYDVKEVFYDGMSFWDDRRGMVFGDPIGGKLQVLITEDGGLNWLNISDEANMQMKGTEGGFAASGTGIRTLGDGLVWIGTGGPQARLLFSYNYGKSWSSYLVPIEQGGPTQGIFSIAINGQKQLIAVGGDYQNYRNNTNVVQLSNNGTTWTVPKTRLSGFKSGVEYINDSTVIATGTSGTDISLDGGITWKRLGEEQGLNVVRTSESGKLVLLAGEKGTIYKLVKEN